MGIWKYSTGYGTGIYGELSVGVLFHEEVQFAIIINVIINDHPNQKSKIPKFFHPNHPDSDINYPNDHPNDQ